VFGVVPLRGLPKSGERIYPAAQVKGYQPAIREYPWSLHILSAMTAGAASTICSMYQPAVGNQNALYDTVPPVSFQVVDLNAFVL
jgi:hypothetical protein